MTKLTMSGSKDNIEYFIDDEPVASEQYFDMLKYLGGERVSSECNTVLSADVINAIKDAKEFVDVVADDRDEAYINYNRQEEVVNILDDFLTSIGR